MANPKSCAQIERELQAIKRRLETRPKRAKNGKPVKWLHPQQVLRLDIQRMMQSGLPHKQALGIALERNKVMTAEPAVSSDAFLDSYEWRRARMAALKTHGAKCQCCGATPADGARMNVDHIKPRKLFPHLALDQSNLQVLCHECNHGKGNWDMTDWRKEAEVSNR